MKEPIEQTAAASSWGEGRSRWGPRLVRRQLRIPSADFGADPSPAERCTQTRRAPWTFTFVTDGGESAVAQARAADIRSLHVRMELPRWRVSRAGLGRRKLA